MSRPGKKNKDTFRKNRFDLSLSLSAPATNEWTISRQFFYYYVYLHAIQSDRQTPFNNNISTFKSWQQQLRCLVRTQQSLQAADSDRREREKNESK